MKKIVNSIALVMLFIGQHAIAQQIEEPIFYGIPDIGADEAREINYVARSEGLDDRVSHVAVKVVWPSQATVDSVFNGYAPNISHPDTVTFISLTYGDCRNLLDLMLSCHARACIPLIASEVKGRVRDNSVKDFSVHTITIF